MEPPLCYLLVTAALAVVLFGLRHARDVRRRNLYFYAMCGAHVRDAIHFPLSFLTLILGGIVVTPAYVLCLPVYYLASKRLWYAIDNFLFSLLWGITVFTTEATGRLMISFYGDEALAQEEALDRQLVLISNHVSSVDFVVLCALAARCTGTIGGLGGLRFIMKHALSRMPLFGPLLAFHDSVFVRSRPGGRSATAAIGSPTAAARATGERERSVQQDTGEIRSTAARLRADCTALWMAIFPEGTRISADAMRRSQEFADAQGLPKLSCLLQPRAKGFSSVVEGVRPKLSQALDVTLAYQGWSVDCRRNMRPAGLRDALCRGLHCHVLVQQRALPEVHEDAAQWLQAIWAEKERQLESWEATESFDAKELKLTLPLRPVLFPSLCYGAALTLISVVIVSGARALTGGGGGS